MDRMKHALGVLLLAGFLSAADAGSAGQAVRATLQQFNDAARKGDQAALEKLLSPDLIYVHSSGKVENRAECLAGLVKGKPNFEIDPATHVNVYGNTAVVHGKMTSAGPPRMQLDFMQVWVKSGGNWQLTARHTTRLAQ